MLWDHKDKGGFEAVYQKLKDGATNSTDRAAFEEFHAMVTGMFHTMGNGFYHALMPANILTFLASFDAIFTLNQDTLIEQKYPNGEGIRQRSEGRFLGWEAPGTRGPGPTEFMPDGILTASDGPFELSLRKQPYIKLHGSSNWAQPGAPGLMLIIGGNKAAEIQKQPLLKWYHEIFQEMLAGSQVVIIGYSFNDSHINDRLEEAARQGARFFVIDPAGSDIIDKRVIAPGVIPQPITPLMDGLMYSIDGASRRSLIATFTGDEIERGKIHHFMTKSSRSII
jgi:hypothetical protein